jgi:hypothetical protein
MHLVGALIGRTTDLVACAILLIRYAGEKWI